MESLQKAICSSSGETARINVEHSRHCIVPFISTFIIPDGRVFPCCMWQGDEVGNLNDSPLANIVNGNNMEALRKASITNNLPMSCNFCFQRESAGNQSMRQLVNGWYDAKYTSIPTNFSPLMLETVYTNHCNLKCRSCNDSCSSSIATENKSPKKVIHIKDVTHNPVDQLLEYAKTVELLILVGGESIINDNNWELLDKLRDLGRTDVTIIVYTNLTSLRYKDKNILEYANIFPRMHIVGSIDAIGPAAEVIRSGCKWDRVEKNLFTLRDSGKLGGISLTLSANNIYHSVDVFKYMLKNKITNIEFNIVKEKHQALTILPKTYKLKVAQRVVDMLNSISHFPTFEAYKNNWKSIVKFMMQEDTSADLHLLVEHNRRLDALRSESIVDVLPELAEIMNAQ